MQSADELAKLALQATTALAIALVSSWVTVQLSLKRFRAERLWDRKVQAYERLIDAFHNSKKFSIEHLDAEQKGENLSSERKDELRKISKDAQEEIQRMADIGSFTLSNCAIKIVIKYKTDINDNEHASSWIEYLEHNYDITCKYMELIIDEAKKDLGK